jgi:hypothetical protein
MGTPLQYRAVNSLSNTRQACSKRRLLEEGISSSITWPLLTVVPHSSDGVLQFDSLQGLLDLQRNGNTLLDE